MKLYLCVYFKAFYEDKILKNDPTFCIRNSKDARKGMPLLTILTVTSSLFFKRQGVISGFSARRWFK